MNKTRYGDPALDSPAGGDLRFTGMNDDALLLIVDPARRTG
ncbi:hypothetical protein [Streptomyces gelaticus]|nr:hypothetical protein [Streptomyces gelaticus]